MPSLHLLIAKCLYAKCKLISKKGPFPTDIDDLPQIVIFSQVFKTTE